MIAELDTGHVSESAWSPQPLHTDRDQKYPVGRRTIHEKMDDVFPFPTMEHRLTKVLVMPPANETPSVCSDCLHEVTSFFGRKFWSRHSYLRGVNRHYFEFLTNGDFINWIETTSHPQLTEDAAGSLCGRLLHEQEFPGIEQAPHNVSECFPF